MTSELGEHSTAGTRCPACHGARMSTWGRGLLKCSSCGLAYYPDVPSDDELGELYGDKYFHGEEYYDYVAQRPALDANFRRRLRSVRPYLQSGLVELGCAYGFFLAMAKDSVDWHLGFDVSEAGVSYAREVLHVEATTRSFFDWRPDRPVGAVVMWDFLEHVSAPEDFVSKSAEILRTGGHLALTTGNIGALVPRLRGLRWRQVHPPTHLFYFTVPALQAIFERHNLRMVRVRHPALWRNARAMVEQVVQASHSGSIARVGRRVADLGFLDHLDVPLNLWDVMEVVAEKRA